MAIPKPFRKFSQLVQAGIVLSAVSVAPQAYASTASVNANLIKQQDQIAKEKWAYSVGVQAYVFGLPLAIFDREYRLRSDLKRLAKVRHLCPCAPVNEVGHMSKLSTSEDQLPYTPNNDTVYSGTLFNISDEPIILSLPDEFKRYWSVQFSDHYLENFAYLGSRASAGKGGDYMLVGPDWQGQAPAGLKLLRMKENIFLAAVRYGVLQGEAGELEAVKKLQQQVLTTSLSNWPQHKGKVKPLQNPRPLKSYQGELAFFEKMADLLAESPPAPAHAAALAPFKTIGIEVGKPFVASKLDEATRKGLARAIKDSQDIMRWKVKYRGTPYDSRWNNLHPGSYGFNYINRAEGALEGLIVHDREEAVYFSTYEDGSGALLDAKKQYVLHFDKDEIPQIEGNGFWSLTMYGPDFQLVSNPIDRFSIGDRTPGLQYNEDGSLTVYIQRQPPEGKESNWLPTPEAGLFRVNYRIYRPSEAASNPKTLRKFIPAIKKLN